MKRLLLQGVMPLCMLIIVVVAHSACHSRKSEPAQQSQQQSPVETTGNAERNPETPANDVQEASFETISDGEKRVNFAGVSFVYSVSLFPDIRAEIVPALSLECSNCKADGYYPRHIRFCFPGRKVVKTNREEYPYCRPEVVVFTIEDYKQAFSISEWMTQDIEREVAALKNLLSIKNISYKYKIPYLEYFDAHRAFQAYVKRVEFQNGKGVLFLTQYHEDPADYVTNEGLAYLFQGLTDDGKYSVRAWFPVTALNFPKDSYQIPEPLYREDKAEADYRAYEAHCLRMRRKLEALSPDQYQPALTEIEKLVRSIRVEDVLSK